jgi:murein DD-endopeptidase MepM/ murein hydrolase activator NlpD
LLNAPAGVARAMARLRPTKSERTTRKLGTQRRSIGLARSASVRFAAIAHLAQLGPRPANRPRPITLRRAIAVRLASERMLPIIAAIVVLGASLISFQPAAAAHSTGSVDGAGTAPRLAVGGGSSDQLDPAELAAMNNTGASGAYDAPVPVQTYADDGTLYKPVAVDTMLQDGRALLQTYIVQNGDTLTGIANHYGVSMMTIWWANKLTAKDELHVGQHLVIPPVTGLVITVKDGDTLDSIAAKYKLDGADILAVNQLEDPNLIIGQMLILPDAAGAPIATTAPPPTKSTSGHKSTSCTSCGPSRYSGGAFAWPVIGGGNYISQGFHYGHWAIDIAADYGSKVVAAAKGTVTFAGWKNNGGGYQVWISHGSGLYTTYNHMSAVTVSAGRSVVRGQQVGRIGASGDATGPHLHFEVWIGPIWNGGTRVNPMRYF